MKYVRNLYAIWEWSFDSPKIQGEQSNGGKREEEGVEKMRMNHCNKSKKYCGRIEKTVIRQKKGRI
jgi:hypothetical protein